MAGVSDSSCRVPFMLLMGSCVLLQEKAGCARPDSTVLAGAQFIAGNTLSVPGEGGQLNYLHMLLPFVWQAYCPCANPYGLPRLCWNAGRACYKHMFLAC